MKERVRFTLSTLVWAIALVATYAVAAQAQTEANKNQLTAKKGSAVQLAGSSLPVQGSGTVGRLTKWTGLTSSSSLIGDTTIFESKNGLVGIGTDAPTSKLTVQGMIETTLGGYKFPDGTVQTTAAVSGLQSVFHNATLTGNGTAGLPLGVAVPLVLSGSYDSSLLTVINTNTSSGVDAISATGGDSVDRFVIPGSGLLGKGGNNTDIGNIQNTGGDGVKGVGGNSVGQFSRGGIGVRGVGGMGDDYGGNGMEAYGGMPKKVGEGGAGLVVLGGPGIGAGNKGGVGLYVEGGYTSPGPMTGSAAIFNGAVEIQGNFSVIGGGTKNFKIDHPLDPENKYLYHAAIESSEVLNIYSGNVTTDGNGDAIVTLPDWFEAINRDFRYQLTVVGTFAQAMVADEIKNNHFKIKTNAAGVKVSWQVTGIRSDAAMLKHPFKVEADKPEPERGSYLAPAAYDQPEERGVEWARHPQIMQRLKQQRLEAEQMLKQRKTVDR